MSDKKRYGYRHMFGTIIVSSRKRGYPDRFGLCLDDGDAEIELSQDDAINLLPVLQEFILTGDVPMKQANQIYSDKQSDWDLGIKPVTERSPLGEVREIHTNSKTVHKLMTKNN